LAQAHAGASVIITGTTRPRHTRVRCGWVQAYLCKPVDDNALLSAIGAAIDPAGLALRPADRSCRRQLKREQCHAREQISGRDGGVAVWLRCRSRPRSSGTR
jgi:hypothetical protein